MAISFYVLLLCAYLAGSIPWSVWLGRAIYRTDPRAQTDGNPGAANAWRAGGWQLGVVVLLLDFLKALIPVAIGRWLLHFSGEQLFWIALMPTLGHAYSVFLRFRGGRGITTWFGVWTALTFYEIPLVMGVTAAASMPILRNDVVRSLAVPMVVIAWLLLRRAPLWMLALSVAQLVILGSKLITYYLNPASRATVADQLSGHSL
jgi:glycerol-3-phosphate acyltransferase PlsY